MTSRQTGGGRSDVFLSQHRCPEVDLLSQRHSDTQIPPTCLLVLSEKSSEPPCSGKSEADYLDVLSSGRSDNENEEEEDEGSVSDWSEEDLSLHFSPSVIFQSDDEESASDRAFECVDVSMETQVKVQHGEEPKMVPKRQIQLKKKNERSIFEQVTDGCLERGGFKKESCHHSDLLQRQHSLPASFHKSSKSGADVDSYRVSQGPPTGASKGLPAGNSWRFQKSLSLDETKTKMASCFIKNILSKKMQVDQSSTTTDLKKKAQQTPGRSPPAEQHGGRTGGGAFKAPVPVVRDMRMLVKHTTTSKRPATFKMTVQEESPPPTYQQAVGVKGHVPMVNAPFSKSQNRNQRGRCPITQQRRGSEPIISTSRSDDVPLLAPPTQNVSSDLLDFNQSEGALTSKQPSVTIHGDRSILEGPSKTAPGSPSESAPGPSQLVLQPCFYSPALNPHLATVSFVHNPLSYVQTHLRRSEENQNRPTENLSNQHDLTRTRTTGDQDGHNSSLNDAPQVRKLQQQQHQHHQQLHQQQHQQQLQHHQHHQHQQQLHQQPLKKQPEPLQQQPQQPFLCGLQGALPPQVGKDFADITGCAAVPGTLISVPPSCHLMLDPKSGQCFYVVTPPQPQRKMLLDPETGQFIQVFLPAASSTPNTSVFPLSPSNPAPTMLHVGGANHVVFSMVPFPTPMAMPSLYGTPCLPVTMTTPATPR